MFVFPDLRFSTLGISIISNFQMVKSYIGSLHTPEVIEKFRKLGASQEVLLVLQQGLFMPYEESLIPKNEFFTHNKTYFENREFANQQLKIWELKGQLHKRNSY